MICLIKYINININRIEIYLQEVNCIDNPLIRIRDNITMGILSTNMNILLPRL